MRTPPRLTDLVPDLAAAVRDLADHHEVAYPDRSLCLIWAHRTPEEQRIAYRAGHSRLDGFSRFSLHNFCPAFAADLWVYTGGPVGASLHVDRPASSAGFKLQLLDRGAFRDFYRPMGIFAEGQGLEWGGRWVALGDGPHVQLPHGHRVLIVQRALCAAGFDPGPADGIDGRKTASAVAAASAASGIPGTPSKRQRALMPLTPPLWAWLWSRAVA